MKYLIIFLVQFLLCNNISAKIFKLECINDKNVSSQYIIDDANQTVSTNVGNGSNVKISEDLIEFDLNLEYTWHINISRYTGNMNVLWVDKNIMADGNYKCKQVTKQDKKF